MADLNDCTLDQANYLLRAGRANRADADAFVSTWNRVKVSTHAYVSVIDHCPGRGAGTFKTPQIYVKNL